MLRLKNKNFVRKFFKVRILFVKLTFLSFDFPEQDKSNKIVIIPRPLMNLFNKIKLHVHHIQQLCKQVCGMCKFKSFES